jgi:hypothetical protein
MKHIIKGPLDERSFPNPCFLSDALFSVLRVPRYTSGPENFSISVHASGPKVSFHCL